MISIIVAIAKNGTIGKNQQLPWYYPEDLQYFKKITTGNTVLMGRKTFDSIVRKLGKPLPNRENVVVTRNKDFYYEGVEVVHTVEHYLKENQDKEVFVIGGREIYEQAIPWSNRLYITHIEQAYDGDVFFPEVDWSKYRLIQEERQGDLRFCIYEKVNI